MRVLALIVLGLNAWPSAAAGPKPFPGTRGRAPPTFPGAPIRPARPSCRPYWCEQGRSRVRWRLAQATVAARLEAPSLFPPRRHQIAHGGLVARGLSDDA